METDNRLIAEFMGGLFNTHSQKYGIGNAEFIEIGRLKNVVRAVNHYSVNDLKYHSDWNWLMEVVSRIENFGFEFFIVESRCKISNNTDKSIETIIDFEIVGTKIEAVYQAVVEFIKWYNLNK